MASAFTHALVGVALAAGAPRNTRDKKFIALLCAASVAPDLDVIAFALGIPYESPLGHRGLSHSIPFAVAVALGLLIVDRSQIGRVGGELLAAGRRSARRSRSTSEQLWRAGLTFVAVASHGVLDAATDGGLGVGFWIPFDGSRYFLPWRPIPVSPIDIGALFSARGLEILAAEMRWIGAPTAALAAAVLYLRRRLAAPAGDER